MTSFEHPPYSDYDVVIGLEVHCQLLTTHKLFSTAANMTADVVRPNQHVAHFEQALPGQLPVLNPEAVKLAVTAGLALDCHVNLTSVFERKHYFYPDLPKGYQITQQARPVCAQGQLSIPDSNVSVRIARIQIEEDAAKSTHDDRRGRRIDLNRASVPLIEIVTEPDMSSADEAVEFLKELHLIVRTLQVCSGNMEDGAFRCDANVSVKKRGSSSLGERCELKNINSFKFIRDAIEFEARRQIDILEAGGRITMQTRSYDAALGQTTLMRDKENAPDYRFMLEPDLPALTLSTAYVEELRAHLPELPAARRARYVRQLGLSHQDTSIISSNLALASYFDQASALCASPQTLANWVLNEMTLVLSEQGASFESCPVSPAYMARFAELVSEDVINSKLAKKLLRLMVKHPECTPEHLLEAHHLVVIRDEDVLQALVSQVIEGNSVQVAQYRAGKEALLGYFVGQLMKLSQGKADPVVGKALLMKELTTLD